MFAIKKCAPGISKIYTSMKLVVFLPPPEAMMFQDGAKMLQDGAKMLQDGGKMPTTHKQARNNRSQSFLATTPPKIPKFIAIYSVWAMCNVLVEITYYTFGPGRLTCYTFGPAAAACIMLVCLQPGIL